MTSQFRRPIRDCIFCGQPASRRGEHLLPDWMANHIHFNPLNHVGQIRSGKTGLIESTRRRSGPAHTLRVPRVCNDCNNTWMSQIEEKAKPILLRMMKHENFEFNSDEQLAVTKWATMKSMVGEYDHEPTVTFRASTRNDFRITKNVPPIIRVWVGATNSPRTEFRHHSAGVYNEIFKGRSLTLNSQISNFCFQSVIIRTASTYEPHPIDLPFAMQKIMHRIYPENGLVKWPPKAGVNHESIDSFLDDRTFLDPI